MITMRVTGNQKQTIVNVFVLADGCAIGITVGTKQYAQRNSLHALQEPMLEQLVGFAWSV
ncbi:MAG: hypothetical protein LW720_20905 [Pirellula sp.]|jgi:hypothetical protein|nr:hypothetical protein [Pirellula sp.]